MERMPQPATPEPDPSGNEVPEIQWQTASASANPDKAVHFARIAPGDAVHYLDAESLANITERIGDINKLTVLIWDGQEESPILAYTEKEILAFSLGAKADEFDFPGDSQQTA